MMHRVEDPLAEPPERALRLLPPSRAEARMDPTVPVDEPIPLSRPRLVETPSPAEPSPLMNPVSLSRPREVNSDAEGNPVAPYMTNL